MTELTYKHTPDMGEISGFGGVYEASCQAAFDAAVKWLVANMHANLHPESADASSDRKTITDVMISAVDDACPGAGLTGIQAGEVIGRCRWIQAHGWKAYVEWMRWTQYHRDMHGGKFVPPGGGL